MRSCPSATSLARVFRLFLLACLAAGVLPAQAATLLSTNAGWRFFKGESAPSPAPADWRAPAFLDAFWTSGTAPFSFGEGLTNGTVLADMPGRYSTVFLRTRFLASDPASYSQCVLRAACDDGFVAWLNGVEIARYNAGPGNRPHDDHLAPDRATFSVAEPVAYASYGFSATALRQGENVLAIQVINAGLTSSDILFDAEIRASTTETTAPVVEAVTPPPGETSDLSTVTVEFSEPVIGVDSGDLMLNGFPASAMVRLDARRYVFRFPTPAYGPVRAAWIPNHGITDTADVPNRFIEAAGIATWAYQHVDPAAPRLALRLPAPGPVRQFSTVEVLFTEPVTGVDASDLLANGVPATSVTGLSAGPYVFTFAQAPAGPVEIRFADGHGIADTAFKPLPFAGGSWTVNVSPDRPDPAIRINEILASNLTGLKDEDGEEQPWIELHNHGTETVHLGGFALSDDRDTPGEWILPPIQLGPGQHLIVFASGKDRAPAAGPALHTGFRLARRGEYLGLFNTESPRRAVHELAGEYPSQRNDIAWGRRTDGTWAYHRTPTPGAPNSGPVLSSAVEPVRFSVERGYVSGAFELVLTCPTPGATIRYSINGADPAGTNHLVYAGPVSIPRTTTVRAVAVRDGLLPSETRTHTYLLGLSTAQRGLPALALATAPNNLTGPTGIVGMQGGTRDGSGLWIRSSPSDYYNPLNRGIAWERPVSVELLNVADNGEFQIDAGLRLHASDYFRPRLTASSKFSWRLYFRGDYGEGRLRHPLMPGSTVEEFDALVCRAGSNDQNPFVRDELVRRLFADCGQVSARGTFVVLYLNGRYSGYYNPVERIESDFLAIQHGTGDDWDVLSQSGALDGTRDDFDALVRTAETGTPTLNSWYTTLAGRLDLTNFVDYLLVNAYGYNGDWPGNNWRAARERKPGAPWRFYVWDAEFSFGTYGRSVSGNTFTELTGPIGTLYSRLRQHPEFRLLFADRVHRHLFNNGALGSNNVVRQFAETTARVGPLIPDLDRSITNTWVRLRPTPLRSHLVGQGLFASSNAPAFRQHGGVVPAGFALTMTNLQGEIWYTTDGTDPRTLFTSVPSGRARQYSAQAPPVLEQSLTVRARSRDGATWSALTEATFSVGTAGSPVRIAEIMYNPPGGAAYEFVEIRNASARPVNLAGYTFEGIECRFPAGTTLPPNAVWVIAADDDPGAFAIRYPGVPVAARFAGSLNNAGEALVLRDATGALVDRVFYRPAGAWPTAPDGTGRSLERTRLDADGSDPDAWQESAANGGTPGGALPPTQRPAPVRIDEVFASNTGQVVRGPGAPDFAELLALETVDLSGWVLHRLDRTNRFTLPARPPLGAGQRLVVWFGSGEPGDLVADFRLDSSAGTLVLADPTGTRRSVFAYGPQAPGWSVGFDPAQPGPRTPRLLVPTPGTPNDPADTAPLSQVRLNEWLPNPPPGADDFIELFNRHPSLPVFLPGAFLAVSNNLVPLRLPAAIAPGGHAVYRATEGADPDELPVRLPATGASIRWLGPAGDLIDEARYSTALEGIALGRFPDGATNSVQFPLGGTPGAPNVFGTAAGPRLAEVLARSLPGHPDTASDWIELHNTAPQRVALDGWRLQLTTPTNRSWAFPAGQSLEAGARIRLRADDTAPPSALPSTDPNTGFALPDTGGHITLLDAAGILRDQLAYGPQLAARSIGIDASGTNWTLLANPTPGRTNSPPATLADPSAIRINEWLAQSGARPDFIELHNAAVQPADLGGWHLTDDPTLAGIHRHRFAPLTFIEAQSWLALDADDSNAPDRLPFRLSATGNTLRLYRPNSNIVDAVTALPAGPGQSAGRFPDGNLTVAWLASPTPGAANSLDDDTDDDGLPDTWESAAGLNPANPADAAFDADGDGRSNLDEYRAGTDPRDPASVLAVFIRRSPEGVWRIGFTARHDKAYILESRSGWTGGWTPARLIPASPGTRPLEWDLGPDPATEDRFYRVRIE